MPTQKDIENAKAFREAIDYLIERAEKRLQFRFDDTNREAMTMLALLNASYEMAKRHETKRPELFDALRATFMAGIAKITGADVRQIGDETEGEGSVH